MPAEKTAKELMHWMKSNGLDMDQPTTSPIVLSAILRALMGIEQSLDRIGDLLEAKRDG